MPELKLNTTWVKGLTEDAVKELRAEVLSSPLLRKRLVAILNEKESSARKESISKDALDKNNWALRQADNCGYRRALEEVVSLILKLS